MNPVPLEAASDELLFGGKAVLLGEALRAGLLVPWGFACSWRLVEATVGGVVDPDWIDRAFGDLGQAVVVRSSGIGEDSGNASFAGQHLTVLNVRSAEAARAAVENVHASAASPGAMAYRARLGIKGLPRIAIVIQRLVNPISSGVMFTRDPMSGEDVRVIEASWGLGEAVVSGLVTPDRYVVERGGALRSAVPGLKDIALRPAPNGDVEEVDVAADLVSKLCLGTIELGSLDGLATACERWFPGAHDIEWATTDEELFLLQRRPITRFGLSS